MTAPWTLSVTVRYEDARVADAVAKSLGVEADGAPPRTRCTVEARGPELLLHIESDDVKGLRAGANSYVRWADAAAEVARAGLGLEPGPPPS